MSGAVPPPAARPLERAARVPRPVCPGCGRYGRVYPAPAPQRAPLRAGLARRGDGGRASPGGVPSTVVRGAWCQALSLPRPPVLWSGRPGFRDPRFPGAVDAGMWTQHRPHSVRPCGPALPAVGVAEGRSRVGCLPPCCEGRLVSGAVPPPTARPLERAARVPRPVRPGCGRCGRVNPAPAPQRAPSRAGVARCGGGGRAFPGGVPSTVVWGAWCQALSFPRPPVLRSGLPGFRNPCVPGAADVGVWTQHRPLMKLKWPQIFGVSLSLELGKAATDLKPCTQCGHWPMLGMSIPCASKYRFRPESGPHQQNIALQDRQSSFMYSVCCTLFHAT